MKPDKPKRPDRLDRPERLKPPRYLRLLRALRVLSLFFLFTCSCCCIYTAKPYSRTEKKHLKTLHDKTMVYYETPEALLFFNYKDFIKELTDDGTGCPDLTKHVLDEYDMLSYEQDSIPLAIFKDHIDNMDPDPENWFFNSIIGPMIDSRRFLIYDKAGKRFVDEIRIRYEHTSKSDENPDIFYEFIDSGGEYIILYYGPHYRIKKIHIMVI